MAKQPYGRSSHMGEVAIRRSNTLMDLVCGPGLAFPFFPPSSVRPWIQEYRWVHLPLPQVSPMGAVRTLSFSVLFLPSRSSPTSHPPTPVPSLPFLRSAFVPSLCCPASVVSLLCCVFCFALLLFCLPGLGSPPVSLPLLCLLVVCSPCPFCLCCFPRFSVVGCGCLSLFPPSFPPRLCVCVCEIPKYRSVGFDVFSIFSPT